MKRNSWLLIIVVIIVIIFIAYILRKKSTVFDGEILIYGDKDGAKCLTDKETVVINENLMPGFIKIGVDTYVTYNKSDSDEDMVVQFTNKREEIQVEENHSTLRFNKNNNRLYYLDNNMVKSYDVETGEVTELIDVECGENDSFYISADEEFVYYINDDIGNKLLKKNIMSGDTSVITNDVNQFDVSGNGKMVIQKTAAEDFGIYIYDMQKDTMNIIFNKAELSNDIAISGNAEYILYTKHNYFWFFDNGNDDLHLYNIKAKNDSVIYRTSRGEQIESISLF